jgi:3-(3-hydroxy-phenyl)propionate hydroxylase
VRARYVIGCDGASSTVRALAGLALQDLEFDEPWLVVDALVNERGLAKLPATSVQYCEPQRPCSFLIGPGNHRRWEIALHADEDPAEMATEAGAWRLLARWLTPDDARLWRQASYRFHALVAQRWRQGRVFIAGDAAHQQPPFLGQGMCQGVRDVANLSWKLRAVLTGTGNDALLDTYGEERGLHVRQLTERIKGIGAVICERDIGKARERDARLVAEAGGRIRPMPRQDVLPRLEAGLIDTSAHAAVGSLFPQPWIARPQPTGHAQGLRAPLTSDSPAPEPVRLDALAGHGWRLVLGAAAPAPSPRCFDAAQAIGLATLRIAPEPMPGALHEVDGVLARWFERHGCSAAIVRPDHYVYGVCSTGLEIDALVQALALRLGADTPAAITRQPETAPC